MAVSSSTIEWQGQYVLYALVWLAHVDNPAVAQVRHMRVGARRQADWLGGRVAEWLGGWCGGCMGSGGKEEGRKVGKKVGMEAGR